jgi:hypothetical protein
MKRIVLTFGVISGLISSAMMFLTLPLIDRGVLSFHNSELIGYTTLFLSFLLVFFGIRAYRDQQGGTITFGRAFAVGILITLISSVFYVVSWEVLYYNFLPNFTQKFAAATIESMRAHGATDAAIAQKHAEMLQLQKLWDNPLTNALLTLIEPVPVGLVVTLVSAGILRRRQPRSVAATPTAALG